MKVVMTDLRRRVLELAKTGPITSNDIRQDWQVSRSSVSGTLADMAKAGLLERKWVNTPTKKGGRGHGGYVYTLPNKSVDQEYLPLETPAKPKPKPSIKPTAQLIWDQVMETLGTRSHMSLNDLIRAGVSNWDGSLHRILKEMYGAGKLARWLAGDHYVYALVNTQPATAKLSVVMPKELTDRKESAVTEKPAPPESDPGYSYATDEVDALKAEVAALKAELLRHKGIEIEFPTPMIISSDGYYPGDKVRLDYDTAVRLRDVLDQQLAA